MLDRSSSLAFRALLKSATSRARLDRPAPRLSGLTPTAVALHAAALSRDATRLLVVATDTDVEEMVADARFFLAAMDGLSADAAERAVLPLPSPEVDPYRGLAPHLEIASERARALFALSTGTARLVVTSARALALRLSAPDRLATAGVVLAPGLEIAPLDLAERLVLAGFSRQDPVDEHGEFCVRGGVVDLYPASESQPIRLEYIGDIIESVRRYDAATQRSLVALDQVVISPQRELLPAPGSAPSPTPGDDRRTDDRNTDPGIRDEADAFDRSASILDYLRRAGAKVIVFEIDDVDDRGRKQEEQWRAIASDMAARDRVVPAFEEIASPWDEVRSWLSGASRISQLAIADEAGPTSHIAALPVAQHHGRIGDWVTEVRAARSRGDSVVFVANASGRADRVIELLADYDVKARHVGDSDDLEKAAVLVTTGQISRGVSIPDANLQIFAETDLFEEERRVHERRKSASRTFMSDFRDLKTGDLVVHVDNGIGQFVGLKRLAVGPGLPEQEFMELRYAGDDKLFVSLERLDLVQKYTGGAGAALDRLGGTSWEKAKTRVKKAMRDMAEELLKLYAARRAVTGHAFSADTHWQQEFDDAFEFELTVDQQSAIADITKDMESPTPMDRLLCGDVGYGKTEVAMRAAFKAVIDGKQVAILAPTTVLTFQHLRTLRERFAGFPVRIDLVSRFRSRQEQTELLKNLASGQLDIIVGTHRLLSKDVVFRDLGLLVVDEEQRFGVTHKEKIKQLKKKVDVLTMTATPIPRTLNMSLAGIRDMSVIETPPRDRLSIQTQVVKFDADVIARAIRTEIERGGQVYLVHNRVESIFSMANLVSRVVPEARVCVGHGQMGDDELERVMVEFVAHKYDVLIATTIVENGLDIPNANTIVINRADRYGLAQLYQLRGRVGRSDRRAYAYLLIPAEQTLSPIARRRLAAIREFSDLGSGFRIAALDLEIRGAGNLLGGEQSGHIEAIGFDMYMKLLEQTIRELKGEDLVDERRAAVNLKLNLRLDDEYIPDTNQRLTAYRRMASARTLEEVESAVEELQDRYGQPPAGVINLAQYARLRVMADRVGLETLDRDGQIVVLRFRQDARLDPVLLIKLVEERRDLVLLPPAVLRLDLAAQSQGKARFSSVRPNSPSQGSASWWTTRAKTALVSPGFRREAILAEKALDPAAPGGLYERLDDLLTRLSEAVVAS